MKASKLRQKEDATLVSLTLRKTKAADYSPEMNPHPEGTLRHDRFRRYYERDVRSFRMVDAQWKDLCEVYGHPYRYEHYLETPKAETPPTPSQPMG